MVRAVTTKSAGTVEFVVSDHSPCTPELKLMKEGDFIERLFVATNHETILFFTDQGRAHWLKVYELPEMSRTSKGRALVNLVELREGEVALVGGPLHLVFGYTQARAPHLEEAPLH